MNQALGAVLAVDPTTGAAKEVYSFSGGADGYGPSGGLLDVDGTLYGLTQNGGISPNCLFGCGTVFAVNPVTGAEKVVYAFQGKNDGVSPAGSLLDAGGVLFGTTAGGGAYEMGTVFALNLKTGVERVLYSFGGVRMVPIRKPA